MKKKKEPTRAKRSLKEYIAFAVICAVLIAAALFLFLPRSLKLDENYACRLRYLYMEGNETVTEENILSWEDMQKTRRLLNTGWHLSFSAKKTGDERYAIVFTGEGLDSVTVCLPSDGGSLLCVPQRSLARRLNAEETQKLQNMLKFYYRETPVMPTDAP